MGYSNGDLVRAGGVNDFLEKIFRCNINVTDICNQNCVYCINADSRNKNRRILSREIFENFIDDIKERIRERALFSIAGGEPLLYPHLKHLLEKISTTIKAQFIEFRFLTNGSLLRKTADMIYDSSGSAKISFVVSIHMDFMNFKKFLFDMGSFKHRDDVICKILMAPGQMILAEKHLCTLHAEGIKAFVNGVSGMPEPYTEEEIIFIKQHSNVYAPIDLLHSYRNGMAIKMSEAPMLFRKKNFDYSGMLCAAGINSLRLAPDGKIIPCFGIHALPRDKRRIWDLSKIRMSDIKELEQPWICPSTYCFCSAFLSAPKWRPGGEPPAWLSSQSANASRRQN